MNCNMLIEWYVCSEYPPLPDSGGMHDSRFVSSRRTNMSELPVDPYVPPHPFESVTISQRLSFATFVNKDHEDILPGTRFPQT